MIYVEGAIYVLKFDQPEGGNPLMYAANNIKAFNNIQKNTIESTKITATFFRNTTYSIT